MDRDAHKKKLILIATIFFLSADTYIFIASPRGDLAHVPANFGFHHDREIVETCPLARL